MLPINPKNIEKLMKSLGMKQQPIDAELVIIKKKDSEIIIENPEVLLINMAGQKVFQISGNAVERVTEASEEQISEEDIKLVMEKTNASYEEAKKALEETGDIAEAILRLQK